MDSVLTQHGARQAVQLGERFAEEGRRFDAIYSSDLGRAMQTARAICEPIGQVEDIKATTDLRERGLGILESLTYPEIAERFPEDSKRHLSGDPDYRPENGESWADLFNRSTAALRKLAAAHDGETILCVSHGGVVGSAMRDCMNMDLNEPRRFHIANTALNVLEWRDDMWHLRTWGDIAHFGGEGALDEMLGAPA